MRDPAEITKDELRELLGKGWLTHDGAWFLSVAGELGMEAANRFNKAAIKGMAPFETRRTMKVLEVEPEDLQDMKGIAGFVTAGLGLIMPDSVITRLLFDFPGENVMHWEWEPGECFAYKSMKQMGQRDAYECGVIYRIECWVESLGIDVEVKPRPVKCLMNECGQCAGVFVFSLTD
jgi:hypothetical protein